MHTSEMVLVESKSARDTQLSGMSDDRAQEILGKVKTLMFAVVNGSQLVLTDQVADFYECPGSTVRSLLSAHRDEFESDGLQTTRGKDFKDVRRETQRTSNKVITTRAHHAITWTPRSVLRLGMLLTQSEIAKGVRTTLLNFVEYAGGMEPQLDGEDKEIAKLKLQIELAKLTKDVRLAEIHCETQKITLEREKLARGSRFITKSKKKTKPPITPEQREQLITQHLKERGNISDRQLVQKHWVTSSVEARRLLIALADKGFGKIKRLGRISVGLDTST